MDSGIIFTCICICVHTHGALSLITPADTLHQAVYLWKVTPQGWFGVNVERGKKIRKKSEGQILRFLSHMQNLNLNTYMTHISHESKREITGGKEEDTGGNGGQTWARYNDGYI